MVYLLCAILRKNFILIMHFPLSFELVKWFLQDQYNLVMLFQCHGNFCCAHINFITGYQVIQTIGFSSKQRVSLIVCRAHRTQNMCLIMVHTIGWFLLPICFYE
ncbi:hypothetical protein ACQJBY_062744 [Aegilops geniculata]